MDSSASSSSSSSYSGILEKTRLPQPSFQRFAVVALFDKLRSAPPPLGLDSVAGRDAVSLCLASLHPPVSDQAVHELCRLVRDGLLEPTAALIELQSVLDGCDPRFVPLFVKGIGFLARFAFRRDASWGCRFDPVEIHPFVKVLSSREEARSELIQQVLLVIVNNKSRKLGPALEFLRPLLLFAILRSPSSTDAASFALDLTSSIASLACSFPSEGLDILKLLTVCLNYFPCSTYGEFRCLCAFAECLANTCVVVLKQVVGDEKLIADAHSCSLDLLRNIFSLFTGATIPQGGIEFIMGLAKHIFVAQRELKLFNRSLINSITVCASIILTQAEFEHEQLSVMKLLVFLNDWKTENEDNLRTESWHPSEELFYIFPVINLMQSPCKSVKSVAIQLLSRVDNLLIGLLVGARREQIPASNTPCISRLDSVLVNLLNCLWFQDQSSTHLSFFIGQPSSLGNDERCSVAKYWTCRLTDYLSSAGRQKVTSLSNSTTDAPPGLSLLLSTVASMFTLHPKVGMSAIDSLAAIGVLDPKLSVPLMLLVLFYCNILCRNRHGSSEMLFKLLAMLPSLASSSIMVPLVLQTIMPMLHKDVNPLLYAAAARLLCKMWMTTDLAFGNMQGILDPAMFSQFMLKREICISLAASVRDVCRHNPDRGVDLILSVSSCIESRDSVVQALGLESLAHLCEADAVDFYTAWTVISEHLLDHSIDPIVAHGLCALLRWGAMDAEAYFEVSKSVLQTLWNLGSFKRHKSEPVWTKVRVSAFKALCEYQVLQIQEAIPEFKRKNLQCLLSEDNVEVLNAMEEFEIKIINIEHTTRSRVLKQKRPVVHKVEKLLDVLPRVIFSSVKSSCTELPGAALLSLVFTPKDLTDQGTSRDLLKLHAAYENAMLEIAESLHGSRDLYLALFILQSWKPFFHRWMRAAVIADSKGSPRSDRSSSAANDILKRLCKVGKECIPRVAVNLSLAIGALCTVVPPSAHFVITDASDFLLKWLFEYEHEHLQWSAAISLGLVSTCFDIYDVNHKLQVINGLLEVLCKGKSHFIKGACGMGLGFACQNLLKGVDDSILGDGTVKATENNLLQDVIYTLCQMISLLCPSTSESLMSFTKSFLPCGCTKFSLKNYDIMEDDAWGVAGLVIGLGSSVTALYRFGAYDALVKITDLLVSWIPADLSSHKFSKLNGSAEISLFMGSCLVLPAAVSFCQRNELIEIDLNALLNRYTSLISHLLDMKKPGSLYQNLLAVSCIGCGSFISCMVSLEVHPMGFNDVMSLLEMMRNTCTQSHLPSVCLGGMLGIVNAFGAGADVIQMNVQQTTSQELTLTSQPLFSNPACEVLCTSMIQEMFLIAKDSKDQMIRKFAAWTLSFLRERWFSNELSDVNLQTNSMSLSQNISEETLVWKLCLWLRDHQYSEIGQIPLATISTVLRCLSRAPRLPSFEWGAIIRRCMKYESQLPAVNTKFCPVLLRDECVSFSLSHAHHISSLLHFIDELSDLVRFRRLELNLQILVLQKCSDMLNLFSSHRLEKLFCDFMEYFTSPSSSYITYSEEQKSALRVSSWKGICLCLAGQSKDRIVTSNLERLMECLFSLLPDLTSDDILVKQAASEEWSVATKCFLEAQEAWLTGFLQVPVLDVYHGANQSAIANKIAMKAKLVGIGRFPASELAELKVQLFNAKTEDVWWGVLVEVAAALSSTSNVVKRQWLLGALEISCVTEYPSTALRFIGLLSGSCCVYMPLLIMDPTTVLSDLPVTLPSLLSEGGWGTIAGAAVEKLLASTERIFAWRRRADGAPTQNVISESEADTVFLYGVMHRTCILLKDYLPFDKRLKLINLEMPENW